MCAVELFSRCRNIESSADRRSELVIASIVAWEASTAPAAAARPGASEACADSTMCALDHRWPGHGALPFERLFDPAESSPSIGGERGTHRRIAHSAPAGANRPLIAAVAPG